MLLASTWEEGCTTSWCLVLWAEKSVKKTGLDDLGGLFQHSGIPPQSLLPSCTALSSFPRLCPGLPQPAGRWGSAGGYPGGILSAGAQGRCRTGHFPWNHEDWICHSYFRALQPGLGPKKIKIHQHCQGSPFHQRRSGPGTYGHGNSVEFLR